MSTNWKNKDCVADEAPSLSQAIGPFENVGIQPTTVIKTPGNERNNTGHQTTSKAQPFKSKGSGYAGG